MQLLWKALLTLSGHTLVFAGGLVFLIVSFSGSDLNLSVQGIAIWSAGLKAMLQLFSLVLMIIGMLTILAVSKNNRYSWRREADDVPDPFPVFGPRV